MIAVMLLGPGLQAVSGVSTHLNQLLGSTLVEEFRLIHYRVGSEGRAESRLGRTARLVYSPFHFLYHLLREKPKIVHLNTSLEYKSFWRDLVYLLIARALHKKTVLQVHGGALPQDFFSRYPILTRVLKAALESADIVVLLASEELKAYRHFSPGLRLALVPNAVEAGDDPYWKTSSFTGARALRVVYAGRIVRNKGVFEIVEAIRIVRSSGRPVTLCIAGAGPDADELKQYVRERGVEDAVSFAGVVRGEMKQRLWVESDLFLFPTYHREGLPYALLESMAARTPVLASPAGGIPDVIEDGIHGLFVPALDPLALANAIADLDRDRPRIVTMGEASRRRIEDYYTVERLAHNFKKIYLQLDGA